MKIFHFFESFFFFLILFIVIWSIISYLDGTPFFGYAIGIHLVTTLACLYEFAFLEDVIEVEELLEKEENFDYCIK